MCITLIFTGCTNYYDYIVLYSNDCRVSENDEKFGEISGRDILIKDFKGNKIVSLELDFVAAQIALAEKYFYVLKRETIFQLRKQPFISMIIKEIKEKNIRKME